MNWIPGQARNDKKVHLLTSRRERSLSVKGKPVIYPVHLTATYKFDQSDDMIDVVQNRSGYLYSRWDNPSVVEVENELAAIEGYDKTLGFGSGMAAITTAIMAHINASSRIVATRELYGGTFEFFNDVLPKLNVETVFVNCGDTGSLLKEIEKGVDILYLETPTNPLLRIVDIKPVAEAAHQQGGVVMLDATFASPVNMKPLDLGVDVAIHSGTKHQISGRPSRHHRRLPVLQPALL
jgi:cystathionine gamma-synthase